MHTLFHRTWDTRTEQISILTSLFTSFTLQLANTFYAIKHTVRRPTPYNHSLAFCYVLYGASFIPLMLSTTPTLELGDRGQDPGDPNHGAYKAVQTLVRAWMVLYAVSTLGYLVLVQMRFRVVKAVWRYRDEWDWAFIGLTLAIWTTTTVLSVMSTSQPFTSAGWTLYALLIDHILSFSFIYSLYSVRRAAGGARQAQWKRVVTALIVICVVTWVCLGLLVIGNTAFRNDQGIRTLMFRVGYAFTPLEFSGALVFIYNAKSLVSPPEPPKQPPKPTPQLPRSKSVRTLEDVTAPASAMPSLPMSSLKSQATDVEGLKGE
ncbi:hypothetical protein SpCBS45565_g06830 [Spizellomyces sp. 'palustris']|nr:hypothetical protein SpCBS45565_g06830 [Spizellomyces sp. 'palustris']